MKQFRKTRSATEGTQLNLYVRAEDVPIILELRKRLTLERRSLSQFIAEMAIQYLNEASLASPIEPK